MKAHCFIAVVLLLQHYGMVEAANLVTITSDTAVGLTDFTTIEGHDVIVSAGAILTVAGSHSINSMTVAGTVTHAAGDTNGLSLMISGELIVAAGGAINVTGKGYPAGHTWSPGGIATTVNAANGYSGASYGGFGVGAPNLGDSSNPLYGSESAPAELGSGGSQGGAGGGRVDINAMSITVDGQIIADGHSVGSFSGAGSGGAIWLKVTGGGLFGTGVIRAAGGTAFSGGLGGGGRIAIVGFGTNEFSGSTGPAGTVFALGATVLGASLRLDRTEVTILTGETRTWASIESTTNHSTVHNLGVIAMSTDVLVIPTGLTLIQDGVIKGATRSNELIGAVTIRSGAVVTHTPRSCRGVQLKVAGTFLVESNALIDVTGKGYAGGIAYPVVVNGETWGGQCIGTTIGGSTGRAGGSYGTLGTIAVDTARPNDLYGSACAPMELGSGGGAEDTDCFGGFGGGRVDIEAGSLLLEGKMLSLGGSALTRWCGGGSGGAVFIRIKGGVFAGSGLISVHGGTNVVGDPKGGGGRIAITGYGVNSFSGVLGGEGTLCLRPGPVPMISRLEAQAAVSWPVSLENFRLESTGELPSDVWSTVTNVPVMVGDNFRVLVDLEGASRFFRLRSNEF